MLTSLQTLWKTYLNSLCGMHQIKQLDLLLQLRSNFDCRRFFESFRKVFQVLITCSRIHWRLTADEFCHWMAQEVQMKGYKASKMEQEVESKENCGDFWVIMLL